MATIRPFRGIRPNSETDRHFSFLSEVAEPGTELEHLQGRLEPGGACTPVELWAARDYLSLLLESGDYITDPSPGLYAYERSSPGGTVHGLFALTSLSDLEKGAIYSDEQIAQETIQQQLLYEREVGLHGSPVLLAHGPDARVSELLARALELSEGFCYSYGAERHRFVRVTAPDQIRRLQLAYSPLCCVHLADGRHRLTCAQGLQGNARDWIFSLYMSTGQLLAGPVHQLVRPVSGLRLSTALARIGEYFFVSPVSGQGPYRPGQKHHLGMYAGGSWFALELRPEVSMDHRIDAVFLREKIIGGVFGIRPGETRGRLSCYTDSEMDSLAEALSEQPEAVTFTLYAMDIGELLLFWDTGRKLPWMSISPRPLFGLLMHTTKKIGEGNPG